MGDRIAVANAWRRDMVARLVSACRGEEAAPIDRALLAVSIPAGAAGDTGFSVSDLRWHRDRLIDKADGIETQIAEKSSKLAWMKGKADRLAEKAGRVIEKSRRVGGTVSRTEYAAVRDAVKAATADVDGIKVKIAGLSETIARMTTEADAHRGAAALLGDLADSKAVRRTEAMRGASVKVEA